MCVGLLLGLEAKASKLTQIYQRYGFLQLKPSLRVQIWLCGYSHCAWEVLKLLSELVVLSTTDA